ncbi:Lipase class 3 [Penicillium cf. griseofulvum]|uniref:Lipase class 3 n=1 Tax=Penicillium cf. griseofulvum TaxID=2972120 RepID=A0A9W9T7C0_9EURO|nr:Lipase class 3 [Penicillium cf. griseofulvum]KAJ5422595.1 Lipase class 3 [Penicillium cf. griseofulvum]KAJ5428772.1 Lipase class 3 [Penicillium cf. griseofulvum]
MLFNYKSLLVGVSLISQAFSAPAAEPAALEARSTLDPGAFDDLQRAAKLSSAAYSGCIGKAFDISITKTIRDVLTDTNGFVGVSNERKTIAVIMRGSTTIADILNDIDTSLVTPKLSGVNFPADVKIMRGLNRPWSAVHDSIIAEVKSLIAKYPDYTLEAAGHSLGGALTYMSHVALSQNFPGKALRSNALAAFPIGNEAWANWAGSLPGTLIRGNNVADGVPNMYVSGLFNFKHYGTEYYSEGLRLTCRKCEGQRDNTCSAGNLMWSVTPGHFQSFGVIMMGAGCGLLG